MANSPFSNIWRKKVWRINRSANRLFIVSTNLDGFNLANREQFAKIAKLFRYTVYGLRYNIAAYKPLRGAIAPGNGIR